jgi:hypothetical protein
MISIFEGALKIYLFFVESVQAFVESESYPDPDPDFRGPDVPKWHFYISLCKHCLLALNLYCTTRLEDK